MQHLINTHAKIEWRGNQPYSTTFGDVYFSSDDGLLETEYVFLQGNKLASRWQQLATNQFTIIETGFGTGLNFLCAARLWLDNAPREATLHFISVEKFPLTLEDISSSLQSWADLGMVKAPLLAQYSNLLQHQEPITLFDDRIQLTLLIGDATTLLSQIENKADAWFLDGFAPAKNPEMWQPALFEKMAMLSRDNTTFATFTSAGAVRRGLLAEGFEVNKRSGFGKKREMLTGHYLGKKP
jgi:tRNA U34 5-methylaminomethyl-2-thiouridine-forming methyltransferase MnmC